MACCLEEFLERPHFLSTAYSHAESKAGSIRSAEHPRILPRKRMRPEASLPYVQVDIRCLEQRHCQLSCRHRVGWNGERISKLGRVDLLLLPTPLKAGLRFRDAVFDCLHRISPCQRAPSADAPALQDDVRIHQHGTPMTRHNSSPFIRHVYAVLAEKLRNGID